MKQVGIVTLLSAIACAAAPVARPSGGAANLSTSKSVAKFGSCFVAAQQRASRAWSYVPNGHGGTFSNLGALHVTTPYFLAVVDRGAARELHLQQADDSVASDTSVGRAVDRCI